MESVTTYCQASYLVSGKLSVVSEMHPKGIYMHPNVSIYCAPNIRIHAPNRSIDMHPKGNAIGNAIGNAVGNTIGNTIGNI